MPLPYKHLLLPRHLIKINEKSCLSETTFIIVSEFTQSSKGFPSSSAGKESACNAGRPWFNSWVRRICWRRHRLPTPVSLGFPGGSAGKESACNVGRPGFDPWVGNDPLEKGEATHCSILAWRIHKDSDMTA